jgi:hypothetical protein
MEIINVTKLDEPSEASLVHLLSALPPGERGWIMFAEARTLFSTKDAQYVSQSS